MTASLMYRAPQNFSFQWNQGSSQLPGATSTSLKAAAIDDYTCTVTATNAAGSAVQTSRTFGVFKIGKPKFNRRKGTAKLVVWAPHGGRLDLLGKGVKAQRPASASALQGSGGIGRIQLLVKPVGKARKHLIRTGRAKVKVHVDYAPIGGTKTTQTRPITLKERRRR